MTSDFKNRKRLRKLCQDLAKGDWQKLAEILFQRNTELIDIAAKEISKRTYPIVSEIVDADNGTHILAWYPAFGEKALRACEPTLKDAIEYLEKFKPTIISHYLEMGRDIPEVK